MHLCRFCCIASIDCIRSRINIIIIFFYKQIIGLYQNIIIRCNLYNPIFFVYTRFAITLLGITTLTDMLIFLRYNQFF